MHIPNRHTTDLSKIISLIDLTSLNETDTDKSIIALCKKAITPLGNVAAICVYSKFIPIVASQIKNTHIKIASVANFPHGNDDIKNTIQEIEIAASLGANEIEIVFPYKTYLTSNKKSAIEFVKNCKESAGNMSLKIILETGAISNLNTLHELSSEIIAAGANFIKTSTGKISQGASLEAAAIMLSAIKNDKKPVGFKASGGIRTIQQALSYIKISEAFMGTEWLTSANFRLGTSQLIDDVLQSL